MRLFQPEESVARIVPRVDHAERAESRADNGMRFDDVERHCPEMRATRSRIVRIHTVDKTIDRELATKQHHTEKQTDQQRTREAETPGDPFHSSRPPVSTLTRLAPDRRHDSQKQDLSHETDDAAARSRHHERHTHQSGDKEINDSLLFIDGAREEKSERQGNRQFHVAGEVVAINKRAKRGALVKFANPINFRWAGERLRQSEDREQETKHHDRSHEHTQTMWRIDKHECRSEEDEERGELDQHEPG